MAVEVALGIVADSLALLSDAAHMLVDAAALGLSVWAARLARRPPGGWMTFGFRRAEILSAQGNGATLLVLGLLIVGRGRAPPGLAARRPGADRRRDRVVGALVNVVALRQVARANRANLNVEGSYRHLLTDLYAFAGTAVAGVVVWTTGLRTGRPDRVARGRRLDAGRRLAAAARVGARAPRRRRRRGSTPTRSRPCSGRTTA